MGVKLIVAAEVHGSAEAVGLVGREALAALSGVEAATSAVLPAEDGWVWSATFEMPSRGEQLHAWNTLRALLTARGWEGMVAMHDCRPGESCRNETYREWRPHGGC